MTTETGIEVGTDPPIGAGSYQPPEPMVAGTAIPMPPDERGLPPQAEAPRPSAPQRRLDHQRLGKPTALAVFAPTTCRRRPTPPRRSSRSWSPAIGALAFILSCRITLAHGRGARHPDLQLPPDDQGLPVGRRRLHRHARTTSASSPPRSQAWPCSPTTSSPCPCRCRQASPRSSRSAPSTALFRSEMAVAFIAV